jgi:hypothetical protein
MTLTAEKTPAWTLQSLMSSSYDELRALYARSEAGPIPDGVSDGLASCAPGTALGSASEAFFGWIWQGKAFSKAQGMLKNRVLGLLRMCPAKVFIAESWSDGKPSIIIDYLGTSLLCAPVRDEIRQVSPNVYLGYAYVRTPGKPIAPLMFALDFSRSA